MDLFGKKTAPKTAEQSGIRAEKDAMRKELRKMLVLAIASLISILGFSAAWFVSNTKVSSTGMRISANDTRTFYLATRKDGQQGVYDDNTSGSSDLALALNRFQRFGRTDGNYEGLPQFTVGTTVVTASDNHEYIVGDANGISLMVNSSSNVNNLTAQNGHIGPGSRGQMTFYIIPVVDGLNQVRITVSLSAYKLTASTGSEGSNATARAEMIDGSEENELLRNLLCGHMLLFYGKDENGDYVNQISPILGADGSILFPFEVKGENWAINQPVEITLYWVWPQRFENLVYAGQSESVFKTFGSSQTDLLTWVNTNRGFIVNLDNPESLEDAGTDMSNAVLSRWSAGYNRADQLIGDTVAYFIWTISAQN